MKSGNVRPKHVFAELEHSEHTKLMGICMWVSGHLGAITADTFPLFPGPQIAANRNWRFLPCTPKHATSAL